MAIEFLCPACRGTLSMPDDSAGKLVRCGNCLATLRVPDAPPAPPPEPPAPRPRPVRSASDARGDRDEHGEPRPRRKSKRAGRGALFWIVIVLGILGLFTCLACGGVWAMLAQPHWTKHDSAGGFTVEFPAPRNANIAREAQLELKEDERVEGAMLVGRFELYWVWYAPYKGPWRKGINDDWLLDQAEKSLVKDGAGRIVRTAPRTVDGCAAREVVIATDEGDAHHHCLIVIGKDKLYIAVAGGLFTKPEGNPRIRRFLDSFHVK